MNTSEKLIKLFVKFHKRTNNIHLNNSLKYLNIVESYGLYKYKKERYKIGCLWILNSRDLTKMLKRFSDKDLTINIQKYLLSNI